MKFTVVCDNCKKELILITEMEKYSFTMEVKDFWVIHCKDCIPDKVIFDSVYAHLSWIGCLDRHNPIGILGLCTALNLVNGISNFVCLNV